MCVSRDYRVDSPRRLKLTDVYAIKPLKLLFYWHVTVCPLLAYGHSHDCVCVSATKGQECSGAISWLVAGILVVSRR